MIYITPFSQESLISVSSITNPPSPRVGTAATTLDSKLYLFSGRRGVAMKPIEEHGAVWEYDPLTAKWSLIAVENVISGMYPAARSYHCTTSDGHDTLYVHARSPEKGRLSDLWAFSLSRKQWTELAPAPDPPRGGTSITFADGKLYRMNGFDGTTEQGGSTDIYTPGSDSWASHSYTADGNAGPTPCCVSALLPAVLDNRTYLVILFGEQDPSSWGHQGAGKMLNDLWAFDIKEKLWTEKISVQGNEVPAA